MKIFRFRAVIVLSTVATSALLGVVAACTTVSGDFPTVAYPDGSVLPDAGGDADSSIVFPVTGCEPSPKDDASVIEDRCGTFVVPAAKGGDDTTGDGTRAKPYATLAKAVARAKVTRKRVYACSATYPEAVVVEGESVDIFGGFVCPGEASAWTYGTGKSTLEPTTVGIGLTVRSVTKMRVEDVAVRVKDGTAEAPTSMAVFVALSSDVAFRRVDFVAGQGAPGKDGVTRTNHDGGVAPAGNDTNGAMGGAAKTCACGTTSSIGGKGGDAVPTPQDGLAGSSTPSVPDAGATGQGGRVVGGTVCSNGDEGGRGQAPVAAQAATSGTLSAGGWMPSPPPGGHVGNPGQGGGGGAASVSNAFGGAGGGCGGCGGGLGEGGTSGGSSFALGIFASTAVSLGTSSLKAGPGGPGGNGGNGQGGQAGGTTGTKSGAACFGGFGGPGSGGGGGGGGAGGHSAALIHSGEAPSLLDTVLTRGTGGGKGGGGLGGPAAAGGTLPAFPGPPGPDGTAGQAIDILKLD
ncbi:MAG: hypothetical protein U0169_10310 [Polyangiaceae bacterium]